MGFTKVVPHPHVCKRPIPSIVYYLGGKGEGTEWTCDTCGRVSVLVYDRYSGVLWCFKAVAAVDQEAAS